ncbi:hypothetical protein BDB01DRAFT_853197 [Pilobolus umbonatus]|nr:hypothetical protein BDB01DRAFT_853197 [Pilobolus umbonatus]
MTPLPTEVVECIVKRLERKDILECSNANTQFYSISMKYLYAEIDIESEANLNLFLNSLARYPRCKEAGTYSDAFSQNNMAIARPCSSRQV